MLQEFITQDYLIIQNNVVTNLVVWNGDTSQWTPPQGSIALVLSTTPSKIWQLNADKTDYVLTDTVGDGAIGFTWDGTYCITDQSKPNI